MSHQVETIAYSGTTPWHNLGVNVPADISTDDMLVMAGLDWTVSQRPLYFPKEEGSKIMKRAHGKYGLVRDTDNKLFDITGERWNPVQNHDVLDFFREFVAAGDMTLETAGSLRGGKFIWALARLGEDFKLGHEDLIANYLLLMSPHAVGYSLLAQYTAIRVVCANTMAASIGYDFKGNRMEQGFRMTHMRKFDDDTKLEAKQALGLAHVQITEFQELCETLSQTRVTDDEVSNFFYEVIQEEKPEAVLGEEDDPEDAPRLVKRFETALLSAPGQDMNTCKGTLFGAVNAVTYVVDHELGRGDDSRLTSAWTGQGSVLKRRAYQLAANLAQAA
jgi:phage/plasmid-like protein (TIGR03299 family)